MSEWKENILSKNIGLRHGFQFREKDFTESGIQVIKIGNVTDNGLNLEADISFVSSKRIEEFKNIIIGEGDILMSLTGNIGRVVEVGKLGNRILFQNYRVGVFYPLNDNIFKPFIKWLLSSDEILRQLNSHANQSAQANFGKQDLDKLKFKIPSYSEQQKITQILGTCDAVIEKTRQAIAKYRAIKQGMLHDLFTRGIDESTGKLRPRYEDAPELYKETKLGMVPREWDVTNILKSTYLKGRIGWQGLRADEFIETGPFLVTGTDFINGRINWSTCYHISEQRFQEAPPIHVNNEDVLITKDGTIGKVAFVIDYPGKAILNSGIFIMHCKDTSYLNQFLYYLLNSELFHKWLRTFQGGSTINHLYQREFERFEFPIPRIEEQKLISNRLEIIDHNMQTEQAYLFKLEMLKQGLMGDLLRGKTKR